MSTGMGSIERVAVTEVETERVVKQVEHVVSFDVTGVMARAPEGFEWQGRVVGYKADMGVEVRDFLDGTRFPEQVMPAALRMEVEFYLTRIERKRRRTLRIPVVRKVTKRKGRRVVMFKRARARRRAR